MIHDTRWKRRKSIREKVLPTLFLLQSLNYGNDDWVIWLRMRFLANSAVCLVLAFILQNHTTWNVKRNLLSIKPETRQSCTYSKSLYAKKKKLHLCEQSQFAFKANSEFASRWIEFFGINVMETELSGHQRWKKTSKVIWKKFQRFAW